MLNRKPSSNLGLIKTLVSSLSRSQSQAQYRHHVQNPSRSSYFSRYFSSSNGSGNGKGVWKILSSSENEQLVEDTIESVFGESNLHTFTPAAAQSWNFQNGDDGDDQLFVSDIHISPHDTTTTSNTENQKNHLQQQEEEDKLLAIEERALSQLLLKDSDHAFGDLIAASGITDHMLDTLMALKDFDDVPGLPPLATIEDMRYQKNTRKSTRADIERQKQQEIAASRVTHLDAMGRAYGTGKRKSSIARVWIQPGQGMFLVNDKQFDVYFTMLDQRAALLRPLSETKTLGLLDVTCTVKGGGMSGQIGAIRLGMSRALQNWAPDQFRPPLKEAGFLTRDSRIVERKKPGKAKARKSFQWVKR